MQATQILTRAPEAKPAPSVTAAKARAAIAQAHEYGFKTVVDADNWLVLKQRGYGEPLSVDLTAPSWVEDLRALLHAVLLIDMSRDGSLAHRNWKPEQAQH